MKLSFDAKDPAERIRACRVVRDMLRRGYALLVEVPQPDGSMAYQRATDFREDTAEYIVADLDPIGGPPPSPEKSLEEASAPTAASPTPSGTEAQPPRSHPMARRSRRVSAATTRAVAVGRTAGG